MVGTLVRAVLSVAFIASNLSAAGAQPPAGKAVEPSEIDNAAQERESLDSERRTLEKRLSALRDDPGVKPDSWADAHVFIKGVVWALDFEPTLDVKTRDLVRKGLRRARERIEALEAGRQPWADKRGRVIRGFVSAVDGSTQPYGVLIPAGYDPARPGRLDVVLHGSRKVSGSGELLFMEMYDDGDADVAEKPAPKLNFIQLFPMGRLGENAYRFEGETDVDEAIEALCRNYRIDRRRVVLRGHSLGGVGTWQLGLKRPDRYAALGPAAAPVDTYVFAASPRSHFIPLEPLTPWQKSMLHLVDAIDYTANAGMVPVFSLMGDQDPYFSSHLLIRDAFKKEGISFLGMVDQGAGHTISTKAFKEQLRRLEEPANRGIDPEPKHIRFVTWTLKYSRCHWIEILGLEKHYRRAEIEARIAEDGSITVGEPVNITRFAVRLPQRSATSPAPTLTVGDAKVVFEAPTHEASRMIVVERRDGRWVSQGGLNPKALAGKRPGLQGPIDDAFATRFLCVRGTGQAWNPAVGAWADASLQRFASEWRRHYRGDLPIKDDTDVTQEDVSRSNLILFGDPGSNPWIAKILPKLPLRWTREEIQVGPARRRAADGGLQLIFPNPLPGAEGRYVVFNSGHTYHDPELRLSYMVFPRVGDWAVLNVGENPTHRAPVPTVAETVLQSGFFDEGWNNPMLAAEAAEGVR